MRAHLKRTAAIATALLATLAAAPSASASAPAPASVPASAATHTAAAARPHISTAYVLPGAKAYPEGIAVDDRTGDVYVGSYADGTVYRARPGQRTAEVFLPAGADGRDTANGLRVDARGRLWVTDSTTGVTVYDPATRTRIAHFEATGGEPFFINDLTITPDGTAYLTDSFRSAVYRVTPADLARGTGTLDVAYDLDLPAGAITLNGIVSDPAGRFLLTVDMTAGELYRIDLRSDAITRVDLRGGDMKAADGLLLSPGGTLRVAHNTTNTLSRWQLSADGTRARLTTRLTDPSLQIPTTLARSHGRTLVVRSQFDKGGPLTPSTGTPTTFTIAAVRGL
ncbi:SMP-30/gluconolactonase/LRE family protein [Streptomyces sp. NPDC089799]|uniref:SMP-30/gluconolactonase/LRE family protein n=1 Tax=Streptomyces sp. NPDC089799 TaxID=3155066 RepID=UPI00342F3832